MNIRYFSFFAIFILTGCDSGNPNNDENLPYWAYPFSAVFLLMIVSLIYFIFSYIYSIYKGNESDEIRILLKFKPKQIKEKSKVILNKYKSANYIKKIKSLQLSSDERIIVSIILGIIVSLFFGCIFGETIYYFNNGNRGSIKNHNYSEFHINYIALFSSFFITAGATYILLNRKNGRNL